MQLLRSDSRSPYARQMIRSRASSWAAALRREIQLVGQAEDFDKFEFLTQVYVRHYGNSIYSDDFWQRFSSALTRSSLALDERRFSRLSAMLEQLDQIFRGRHFLALLFSERPYIIPLMLNQFFEITFSYCCKTRLHCRHTFRYTTRYTAPWP